MKLRVSDGDSPTTLLLIVVSYVLLPLLMCFWSLELMQLEFLDGELFYVWILSQISLKVEHTDVFFDILLQFLSL